MGVAEITAAVESRSSDYIGILEEMVNIDSGSFSPAGVNRIANLCEQRFWDRGWQVERVPHSPIGDEGQLGDLVIGRSPGDGEGPRILLIGHTDTVFDDGTAAERPFRIEDGFARGPGVSDMKSGLLGGFFALEVLQDLGLPIGNVTYLCNPDEEIGSPFSGAFIKELAQVADVALVLESGRENGDVVSQRKGVIDFAIHVHGRAAHAGVEPERGRSALVEAARLVGALHGLNGRWPGVTVNVGTLSGGSRSNVIAEHASMMVDVRSPEGVTLDEAEREIERLCMHPVEPDVAITAIGRRWHRPMEKSEVSQRLVDAAREIAAEIGFELVDSATGGASDACTTSAAGVPTLDGLGPVGGGDHSPTERIDMSTIVPRVSLVAGIVSRVAERGGV
jgi:glutamate carboxypeptidase